MELLQRILLILGMVSFLIGIYKWDIASKKYEVYLIIGVLRELLQRAHDLFVRTKMVMERQSATARWVMEGIDAGRIERCPAMLDDLARLLDNWSELRQEAKALKRETRYIRIRLWILNWYFHGIAPACEEAEELLHMVTGSEAILGSMYKETRYLIGMVRDTASDR